MARDKRKGGRVTPKGTRPPHLRPVGEAADDRSPVDQMIDSGGGELLEEGDPIGAETWASAMVDVFERARWKARLDRMEVPPFEDAMLHRCRQRRDQHAAVVATALAAVLFPPHDRSAVSIASELRRSVPGLPAWLGAVGAAEPTRGWIASDVFGDQASLIVGFAQDGDAREHALVVLVDHNLSGQAKDAWIAGDADEVVANWKSSVDDPHMRMDEVPVQEALRRLRDAVAMSDLWNGDTELRTQEFAQHRALIWSRLRRAGLTDDRTPPPEVPAAERDALVDEFMASAEGRELTGQLPGADVELLAGYLGTSVVTTRAGRCGGVRPSSHSCCGTWRRASFSSRRTKRRLCPRSSGRSCASVRAAPASTASSWRTSSRPSTRLSRTSSTGSAILGPQGRPRRCSPRSRPAAST